MKKETVIFLSDVLVGGAAGIIIDYFAGTSFIFTALGLAAGVVLAIILKKKKG